MKPFFGMLAVPILLFASGCAEQVDEMERVRQERVEQVQVEQDAFEDAEVTSLDLTDQLMVGMDYGDVESLFGYEGELKMNLTGPRGERKVYEWWLDGGVNVRVTFDDGAATKWEIR